jgi:DNA-binding transcriptional MerR regulator
MRTTTDPTHWRFYFTISDLGRFLGKSPVTLRGWERSGFVTIPREGNDRKLDLQDIREIAIIARKASRITNTRFNIVNAAITLLELVERENSK